MRLPAWFYGLLASLWAIFSFYYYFCNKCGCCGDTPAAVSALPAVPTAYPLSTNWDKSEVIKGATFDAYKTGLLAKGGLADTLVVKGLYRSGEKDGPKLGLARAESVKKMLAGEWPADRIRTVAEMVNDGMNADKPTGEAVTFDWIKGIINRTESTIIETANSATILFPFGSTARDRDRKVEDYLKNLCQAHAKDGATFTIVGHTDNVGNAQSNVTLGLNRAKAVAAVLSRCGIASSRIQTDSKGSSEPIADNNTDEGRHQNRRVVITVTPQ